MIYINGRQEFAARELQPQCSQRHAQYLLSHVTPFATVLNILGFELSILFVYV